jgi:hypothetical protein
MTASDHPLTVIAQDVPSRAVTVTSTAATLSVDQQTGN